MKVALVCIAKNEDNYIQEWIDYHLKLGFDEVFVYKNNWEYSNDSTKVNVINFPGEVQQLKAYNTFINTHHGVYDWAAFFDVDEFLVLKKHKNIKEFLSDYNSHDVLAINWVFFGNNGNKKVEDGNYSMIQRFTKRCKDTNFHIKTICKVKPEIQFTLPHNTNKPWVTTNGRTGNGPFNHNGDDSVAQLNHYFFKSWDEFVNKVGRGRADTRTPYNINSFNFNECNDVEDYTAYKFYYDNE